MTRRIRALGLALGLTCSLAAATLAEPFSFSNVASNDRTTAQNVVEAHIGGPIEPERINVAAVDLNGDGQNELFVFAFNGYYCGTKGCTPLLLQKHGDSWENILFGDDDTMNDDLPDWSILDTSTDGYSDLSAEGSTFKFDGEFYRRPKAERVF